MTLKTNIAELKSYAAKASKTNKDKINNIIKLYEERKIPNFKTAQNAVIKLSFAITTKNGQAEKEYNKVIAKYGDAQPITGRIAREIQKKSDEGNYIEVTDPDFSKARSLITFKFLNSENNAITEERRKNLSTLITKYQNRIEKSVSNAFDNYKSMKIKMRLHLTYEQLIEDFDGNKTAERREAILGNKQVHTITKHNMKNAIEEQLQEMASKVEVLDQKDAEGKSLGSGWTIVSIDKLAIVTFETKPLRGSSYIETPEKYSNSRCGLINIRNEDEECFRWCMLYHQSDKSKNSDRVSALKKITDKYNYDGMVFLVDYASIETFEELNKVCIFVYELDEESKIRLSKAGKIEYLTNDLVYLLRIDKEEKSHYIYIKKISHFFNLSTQKGDKDQTFCPICSQKVKTTE